MPAPHVLTHDLHIEMSESAVRTAEKRRFQMLLSDVFQLPSALRAAQLALVEYFRPTTLQITSYNAAFSLFRLHLGRHYEII